MSPGIWFIILVFGLAFLGSFAGLGGTVTGLLAGFALWCVGGLWWLVDYGYDCTAERDAHAGYTVSERCS